jgi:hypothetical protein
MPAGLATPVTLPPAAVRIWPAMPTLSLCAIVLLMIALFSVSTSEMPPPAHPASLFTIMLFVTVTLYQRFGLRGLCRTSWPLTCCSRMPPPWPVSEKLPRIRFESIVTLPVPSSYG